jgi:hypothetical protein
MKTKIAAMSFGCIAAIAAGLLSSACKSTYSPARPDSEARRLERLGVTELHLDFGGKVTEGAARNVIGVRSESLLLSRRIDSRTYFVQDKRYGVTGEAGVFAGADEELLRSSREVATHLGVPPSEVERAVVLRVQGGVAGPDGAGGKLVVEETLTENRLARLTRRIDGVPVFSSRLLLGLTRDQRIGFMELHWPEIPPQTVIEARRYAKLIQGGWKAPYLVGAEVESVEAGILHSPAVGFVMDIQPVIRVIYAPDESRVAKKPVLYLNADGKPVPLPRQFEKLPEHARQTRQSEEDGKP